MQNRLAENIRLLRQQKNLTQAALAEVFELNRTTVSAWEDGRAEPRVALLLALASYFEVTLDVLFFSDLTVGWAAPSIPQKTNTKKEAQTHILPIAVDRSSQKELITVVPVRAAAGYLHGYGDVEFIASLPTFNLPVGELPQDMSLRLFQIEGDSMLPLPSGSYVLASFVEDHHTAGNRYPYIAVTQNDGIVFKRIENHLETTGTFRMISDNPDFQTYDVQADQVIELWRARAFLAFELPQATNAGTANQAWMTDITQRLARIEKKVKS